MLSYLNMVFKEAFSYLQQENIIRIKGLKNPHPYHKAEIVIVSYSVYSNRLFTFVLGTGRDLERNALQYEEYEMSSAVNLFFR